jgi:hypothetical protein
VRPGAGRPPTVHGTEQFNVRVSPELLARLRDLSDAEHVSAGQSVRMLLALAFDSLGDTAAAMWADPRGERTAFVERVEEQRAERGTVRARPA